MQIFLVMQFQEGSGILIENIRYVYLEKGPVNLSGRKTQNPQF
jgi:hypothetical protein